MLAKSDFKKITFLVSVFAGLFVILFATIQFSTIYAQEVGYSVTNTPSSKSLFSQNSKEEALILSNGKCSNVTSTGLLGQFFEIGNKILSKEYSKIGCAKDTAQAGNPQMLASLLRGEDGPAGLLDGVMALNGNLLDQRPASGTEFVEQKVYALQNFGKVSAQDNPGALYYRGTGFDLLRPVQGIWGFSVNVVYGLLIFIIIGVAFGIMFRSKLGGDAVVTLQNAIPNIALAMILVPLSYAISGLFIDGITLGVNVTHAFFFSSGSPTRDVYLNRNTEYPCNGVGLPYATVDECDRGLHADDIRVSWLYSGLNLGIADELSDGPISGMSAIFFATNDWISSTLSSLEGFIGPIANFLIGLLLVFTGIRIFWLLLQKFMIFTLAPIFSPFVFATIAIPGNGIARIMDYAKFLGAATLNFVVAYGMILLSMVLSSAYFQSLIPGFGNSTFTPPLLGLDQLPALSPAGLPIAGSTVSLVFALLAVAIYLLIPKALHSIDEMMGANKGIPFIGDVFQSAKDSFGVAKAGVNATRRTIGAAASAPKRLIDANIAANRAWNRATTSVTNTVDRLRGRRPGEAGTKLAKDRDKIQSDINEFERNRRDALASGNDAAARLWQTRINQKKRQLEAIGEGAGVNEGCKEAKPQGLKAEITWAGQQGPVTFTEAQMKAIYQAQLAGRADVVLAGGKLSVSGDNFDLPPNIINVMSLMSVKEDRNLQLEEVADTTLAGPPVSTADFNTQFAFREGRPPAIINTGFYNVEFAPLSESPSGDGKKWEAGFFINIPNPAAFLAKLTSIGQISSQKVIIRVNMRGQNVDSNRVRLDVQASGFI